MAIQLDLFTFADERASWAALFERAEWTRGRLTVRGWMCPACRVVEPNLFILWQNHSLDPDVPQDGPLSCREAW